MRPFPAGPMRMWPISTRVDKCGPGRSNGTAVAFRAADRRIAANYQVRQSSRNFYVNKINAGSRLCALRRVIKCAWSSLSLLR